MSNDTRDAKASHTGFKYLGQKPPKEPSSDVVDAKCRKIFDEHYEGKCDQHVKNTVVAYMREAYLAGYNDALKTSATQLRRAWKTKVNQK
jgi:hypothetical protein